MYIVYIYLHCRYDSVTSVPLLYWIATPFCASEFEGFGLIFVALIILRTKFHSDYDYLLFATTSLTYSYGPVTSDTLLFICAYSIIQLNMVDYCLQPFFRSLLCPVHVRNEPVQRSEIYGLHLLLLFRPLHTSRYLYHCRE